MSADTPKTKINMSVYTPKPLQRRIKAEAARRGMSMSNFVLMCVQKEMDRTNTTDKERS